MVRTRSRPTPATMVACLSVLVVAWLCAAATASAATQTWDTPVFGGSDWVVPAGITSATFELRGGQGGPANGSTGGPGGGGGAATTRPPPAARGNFFCGGGAPPRGGDGPRRGAGAGTRRAWAPA